MNSLAREKKLKVEKKVILWDVLHWCKGFRYIWSGSPFQLWAGPQFSQIFVSIINIMSWYPTVVVLGRILVAFIENKGHFNCSWEYSSDTREQVKVREWLILCHGVGQGWHLPTTLGYKWRAEWINILDPLGLLFPIPLTSRSPYKSLFKLAPCLKWSARAWSLPMELLQNLHMERDCKGENWAHQTAQEGKRCSKYHLTL